MDIYWIQDGVRQGPLPPVEIVSMIEADELPRRTRGWHEGCAGWMPLDELPALAPFLDPKPSGPVPDETPPAAEVKVIAIPPPTLRLWAKLADILTAMALTALPILIFGIPFSQAYLMLVGLCPALVLYEAVCLSLFGTTPGRALLNIQVLTVREERIPFTIALARSVSVYILGLGFLSFPLVLMMPFVSWWLTRERGGVTPWDYRLGLISFVSARIPFWRILLCAWMIVAMMEVIVTCMAPWAPDIAALVPEFLRSFTPPEGPQ